MISLYGEDNNQRLTGKHDIFNYFRQTWDFLNGKVLLWSGE
jgi:hypothetical protein